LTIVEVMEQHYHRPGAGCHLISLEARPPTSGHLDALSGSAGERGGLSCRSPQARTCAAGRGGGAGAFRRAGAGARGLAPAAAFPERAALLTPDPARRAQRLLSAARAKRNAGALDAALGLLDATEAGPLDALALRFTDGYAAAVPALTRALGLLVTLDISVGEARRWLGLAGGRASMIARSCGTSSPGMRWPRARFRSPATWAPSSICSSHSTSLASTICSPASWLRRHG
jgi:hypothetical protein